MKDIKTRYWLIWLVWKLSALATYIVLGGNEVGTLILGFSLITSIPFYLYILKLWPFQEKR